MVDNALTIRDNCVYREHAVKCEGQREEYLTVDVVFKSLRVMENSLKAGTGKSLLGT